MYTTNALLSNQKFIELDSLLNRFNIFEATDMGRQEIKHTKFLAYLLNPNESHGLNDDFLCAFLSKLPLSSLADQEILSLHTELAQVSPEWSRKKDYGQIDLVLRIPIINAISGNPKILILAIENKINATQGSEQLKNYAETLKEVFHPPESFKIIKYFLTNQEEESLDETWHDILYRDTVIPAIKQILRSKNEKSSAYIKFILEDYLHLMDDDEESDAQVEELAQKIDFKILDEIRKHEPEKLLHKNVESNAAPWHNLWLKYPKACKFLSKFNGDPLTTKVLKPWMQYGAATCSNNPNFHIEQSNRKYFRFSVLTKENERSVIELSKNSTKKGVKSFRNILFEISLIPIIKEAEGMDDLVETENYKIGVKLLLGPLSLDVDTRLRLVNHIRESFEIGPLESCSPMFTTLVSSKELKYGKMQKINIKGVHTWIGNNIIKASPDNKSVILNENIIKTSETLNDALDSFFKKIMPNLDPQQITNNID